MNFSEILGTFSGYPLGLVTGSISFMRAARMFHPCGVLVKARVENLDPEFIKLHPYVMIRFSSATWKHKEWVDVLGISLRFSQNFQFEEKAKSGDQDLLLASFKHPWQTPVGPLLTNFHDFFSNNYYGVSPFEVSERKVIFRMTAEKILRSTESRNVSLIKNIKNHSVLRLWVKENKQSWRPVSDIVLSEAIHLNQEKLFFNPFLNGLNIKPRGFVHHLRIGTYRLSQNGRTFRHKIENAFHQRINSRPFKTVSQ